MLYIKLLTPLLPESPVINIFFVIREFVRFCSIRHLYVKVFLLGTNISVCLYNTGIYRLRLVYIKGALGKSHKSPGGRIC